MRAGKILCWLRKRAIELMTLDTRFPLTVRTCKGVRVIAAGKWFIDRSTSVGEDADIYEWMPHNGKRLINRQDIVSN